MVAIYRGRCWRGKKWRETELYRGKDWVKYWADPISSAQHTALFWHLNSAVLCYDQPEPTVAQKYPPASGHVDKTPDIPLSVQWPVASSGQTEEIMSES